MNVSVSCMTLHLFALFHPSHTKKQNLASLFPGFRLLRVGKQILPVHCCLRAIEAGKVELVSLPMLICKILFLYFLYYIIQCITLSIEQRWRTKETFSLNSGLGACASSPCLNGMCEKKEHGYECVCDEGYSGVHCNNHGKDDY